MKMENLWLGTEDSLKEATDIEGKIIETPHAELKDISDEIRLQYSEEEGEFGDSNYMVSRAGNVAIVSISGSLTSTDRVYNRYIGRISYDEIRNAVISAAEAEGIEGILLDMDTPGGEASGVSELSDFLSEVNENTLPIFTYTGTKMASGGYWLGSVGREIYAAKLATVGSIGVITVHASYKEMYKDMGIDVTVLRSGEFKALGSPYEKLDDKARDQIQTQMDTIYDVFLESVSDQRGMSVVSLKETAAEGRLFVGEDAVTVGLVDKITSFDEALAAVSKKVSKSDNRLPLQSTSDNTLGIDSMRGKKKVLTEAGVAAKASGVPESELLEDETMFELTDDVETDDAEADAADEEGAEGDDANEGDGDDSDSDDGDDSPDASDNNAGSVDVSALGDMITRLGTLAEENAQLKVKLASAETDRDSHASVTEGLKKIAISAIQRMQISMGAPASNLSDMDASALLTQHNRTNTQFNQRFKVGASAEVPETQDADANTTSEENQSVSSAVTRLTSGKVN